MNQELYYQGRPCKNGHTLRQKSDKSCIACKRENTKKWRAQYPEKAAKWKKENRERSNQHTRDWRKRNPHTVRANTAKAKLKLKQASLPLSHENEIKFWEIYRDCPKGYEVDHMIPLNNPIVCGLHVPWNLQYLTKAANQKKTNSFKDG